MITFQTMDNTTSENNHTNINFDGESKNTEVFLQSLDSESIIPASSTLDYCSNQELGLCHQQTTSDSDIANSEDFINTIKLKELHIPIPQTDTSPAKDNNFIWGLDDLSLRVDSPYAYRIQDPNYLEGIEFKKLEVRAIEESTLDNELSTSSNVESGDLNERQQYILHKHILQTSLDEDGFEVADLNDISTIPSIRTTKRLNNRRKSVPKGIPSQKSKRKLKRINPSKSVPKSFGGVMHVAFGKNFKSPQSPFNRTKEAFSKYLHSQKLHRAKRTLSTSKPSYNVVLFPSRRKDNKGLDRFPSDDTQLDPNILGSTKENNETLQEVSSSPTTPIHKQKRTTNFRSTKEKIKEVKSSIEQISIKKSIKIIDSTSLPPPNRMNLSTTKHSSLDNQKLASTQQQNLQSTFFVKSKIYTSPKETEHQSISTYSEDSHTISSPFSQIEPVNKPIEHMFEPKISQQKSNKVPTPKSSRSKALQHFTSKVTSPKRHIMESSSFHSTISPWNEYNTPSVIDTSLQISTEAISSSTNLQEQFFKYDLPNSILLRIFSFIDFTSLWSKALYKHLEAFLRLEKVMKVSSTTDQGSKQASYNRIGGELIDIQLVKSTQGPLRNYNQGILEHNYWKNTSPYSLELSNWMVSFFWGKRLGDIICLVQGMDLRNRSRGFPQRIALTNPDLYFIYNPISDHVESKFPLRTWYQSFPVWAEIKHFSPPCVIFPEDLERLEDICSKGALERVGGTLCLLSVEFDCLIYDSTLDHDSKFINFLHQGQDYIQSMIIKWPMKRQTMEYLVSKHLDNLQHLQIVNTRLPSNIEQILHTAPRLNSVSVTVLNQSELEKVLQTCMNMNRLELILAPNLEIQSFEVLLSGHSIRKLSIIRARSFAHFPREDSVEPKIVDLTSKIEISPSLQHLTIYHSNIELARITYLCQSIQQSNIQSVFLGEVYPFPTKAIQSLLDSEKLEKMSLVSKRTSALTKNINRAIHFQRLEPKYHESYKYIYLPSSISKNAINYPAKRIKHLQLKDIPSIAIVIQE